MSLFSSLLGCFSDNSSRRVGCAGEDHAQRRRRSKDDRHQVTVGDQEVKKNARSKAGEAAPIPVTYFPSGTRLSLL
ncbi:uncharacterized protein J3R85_013242 [Psidium guajava]|nr:uncharacterized protein J3R85_013242 [Psidium guajava]